MCMIHVELFKGVVSYSVLVLTEPVPFRNSNKMNMCGFSAIMLKHCRRETAIQVGRSSRCDPCTIKRKRAWLVKNKLVQVQSHLGKVEAREVGINALAKAKEAVKEDRQLIMRHQKLQKIAHQSELGWAIVEAHVNDDLADYVNNEKRIESAVRVRGREKEHKEETGRNEGGKLESSSKEAMHCWTGMVKLVTY